MNSLVILAFACMAATASASVVGLGWGAGLGGLGWGHGAGIINPHALSPIGPSGIVTGAGAAGPSGVVTGAGAVGPSGVVNGHGAVGPTGPNGVGVWGAPALALGHAGLGVGGWGHGWGAGHW
ncbi:collagen alpha-2(I) chain-like [Diabrotica virgifera virgifera]|uniref:Collagen alpha-2(I) chain-like n=1 Tax=Diabrotica virgifera virgifera TaxID=50390 RepID=A0A6P7FEN1_DIAVI|nr:collagen alpha-2(I) chain-like [Diabrotica virgifera virgifera]